VISRPRWVPGFWGTVLTLCLAAVTSPLCAQQTTLNFDPQQTQVEFTLGDVLHTVRGSFKLKRGTITYDPASGAAQGKIVVDATSGDSGSSMRDRKMHKEILESQMYPEISFIPDHVTGDIPPQGDFQVQVHGTFRIHGGDHDLTLYVQAQRKAEGMALSTQFEVPYQKWGMKNPSTLFLRVSDTVHIQVYSLVKPD
jgi:polyisoprenoid-binding protein YceI